MNSEHSGDEAGRSLAVTADAPQGLADAASSALAEAEARIAKFLRRPPKRIAPEQVAYRRCRAIRKAKRRETLKEIATLQGWKCAYCRQPMTNGLVEGKRHKMATVDHVLPVSRGGGNGKHNLVAACYTCNCAKGDMTLEEWRSASSPPIDGRT